MTFKSLLIVYLLVIIFNRSAEGTTRELNQDQNSTANSRPVNYAYTCLTVCLYTYAQFQLIFFSKNRCFVVSFHKAKLCLFHHERFSHFHVFCNHVYGECHLFFSTIDARTNRSSLFHSSTVENVFNYLFSSAFVCLSVLKSIHAVWIPSSSFILFTSRGFITITK